MNTGEGCESEESMKRRAAGAYVTALEGVAAAARDLRQHGVDLAGDQAKAVWVAIDKLDEHKKPGS